MRVFRLIAAGCVLGALLFGAENPFIGTWKLKPEKSTFTPGEEMKELTVSFTADGSKINRVASGTYVTGKSIDEGGPEGSSFAWDGKEHVVHDAPPKVAITCTPVKNGSTQVTIKTAGKVVTSMRASVAARWDRC